MFFYLLLCNLKRKTVDVLVTGPRGKKEFIQVDELYRAARFANFERILGFSVPSINERKIAKFCGFKSNFYSCFDPKYISKYAPDCITEHPNFKNFPEEHVPGPP